MPSSKVEPQRENSSSSQNQNDSRDTPTTPPPIINTDNIPQTGHNNNIRPKQVYPSWKTGSNMEEHFTRFDDNSALIWYAPNIKLGSWDDERESELEIETSLNVQNNGSLYAHMYLSLDKASPNPYDPRYRDDMVVYTRKLLTRYHPKQKLVKTKNLILGNDETEDTEDTENKSKENGYYLPILFVNDFWILKDHLNPINETVKTLPLNIKYYPLSFMKLQLYIQLDESARMQAQVLGAEAVDSLEEVKRMLKETNPILLAVTFIVSILHNITHWKDKKEMTGVSVRSILLNIFFQVVIFLYLMDNNQETSWMILIGQGISVAVEIWKIKKAVDVEIKSNQDTTSFFPYTIKFVDKHKLSETEKKTKEYDQLAFRYLSLIAYPLLFCYSIYSLIYNTYKSWYSFILTTLVGFVYAFGFIMMTPQLFINYKLKSIAHMPWKTLMYKTLGTFVDDLFAFCIKMPTLHRLACLRDDVVFFVYLYQRWIYPVDDKRANEYGQVANDEDEKVDKNNNENINGQCDIPWNFNNGV
ncbi:8582_t:CDS:10 [Diversispora eburnea]|uniref:8582_t:CDS:1 n=1 Tax=Diversispora eburnea TaxID=1213867 RepID=A0A9N8UZT6_9GLOM|nr:8582_t:CDS:10 [Diversispora eburnea]